MIANRRAVLPLAAAALAALVLAATGCGGGGSKDAAADTTTTAATTTTDTTSTDTTSTDTTTDTTQSSDGTSTATTADTSSGSGSDASGVAAKCLDFAGAAAKLSQAFAASASGKADASGLKTYFDGLAAKAPGDIKDAFQTLAGAISTYAEKIKGLKIDSGGVPSAGDIKKLEEASAAFSSAKVRAASEKINAWVKAGCK